VDRSVTPTEGLWSTLAGFRFFFAAWVLFDHTYNFGPPETAMPVFTKSGLVAVLCFLAISGFSIHHSIAQKPQGYVVRRFWRIVPINTLAILVAWIAYTVLGLSGGYGTPATPPRIWDWLVCLLLLESVVPVLSHVPFLFPAWSLSVEAIYYVFAPLLRRLHRLDVLALVALSSGALFVCWPLISRLYISDAKYGVTAVALIWAWIAGWVAYARPARATWVVSFIVLGCLGIWTQARDFGIVDTVSAMANVVAWCATILILFYRVPSVGGDTFGRILSYLGEISYPLYLLHYPVLFAVTSAIGPKSIWNTGPFEVAVAIAAAVLAYHTVDRPMRLLGRVQWRHGKMAPVGDAVR
jgi:peptidoglycan/LPS O-acetylase OafA/YrhL